MTREEVGQGEPRNLEQIIGSRVTNVLRNLPPLRFSKLAYPLFYQSSDKCLWSMVLTSIPLLLKFRRLIMVIAH